MSDIQNPIRRLLYKKTHIVRSKYKEIWLKDSFWSQKLLIFCLPSWSSSELLSCKFCESVVWVKCNLAIQFVFCHGLWHWKLFSLYLYLSYLSYNVDKWMPYACPCRGGKTCGSFSNERVPICIVFTVQRIMVTGDWQKRNRVYKMFISQNNHWWGPELSCEWR